MDSEDELSLPGIIIPQDPDSSDRMNIVSHAVLDDVLYNVIHDIVLQAHREEKIARANTSAILVEQKAASSEPIVKSPRTPHRVETAAARYDDGEVYLRGNPLQTTKEIRCPKCNLPRLLYPTTGLGSQPAAPGVQYCKRHPYISKPDHDIYGIPFPVEDVKAPRKNAKIKIGSQSSQGAENGSFEGDTTTNIPPQQTGKENGKSVFPTTKCSRCLRYIAVRDYRKHLMACMGISSRSSGRAAVLKNSNISSNGLSSHGGSTPPASRKSTPALGASFSSASEGKLSKKVNGSPMKRERERYESEDEEDDDKDGDFRSEEESPKKKLKKKHIALATARPKPKLEVLKKWKSGKVTTSDGKMVKKAEIKRARSDSSNTLSSP